MNANTTYIASYYVPAGHYAFDSAFFATTGVTNGSLRALASGEDGPNGVYMYGPSSAFPANSFNAANYWADVLFK